MAKPNWKPVIDVLDHMKNDLGVHQLSDKTKKLLKKALKSLESMYKPVCNNAKSTADDLIDFDYKLLKSVDPKVLGVLITASISVLCEQADVSLES